VRPILGPRQGGFLADKTSKLILDGLRRAAAAPAGVRLFRARGTPGLFSATAAGKLAAQRCQDEGYLRLVRTEQNGKSQQGVYALSDTGRSYLLGHVPVAPAATRGSLDELILRCLTSWHDSVGTEDCRLPALYQQAKESFPGLTIGQFHDALRSLQSDQRIYLHPWTGPLYAMPEPAYALLSGHQVVYYASLRKADLKSGVLA